MTTASPFANKCYSGYRKVAEEKGDSGTSAARNVDSGLQIQAEKDGGSRRRRKWMESGDLYSYAPLGAAGHKSVSRVCISAQDKSQIFNLSVKEADRKRNLRVSRQVSMMTVSGVNKEFLDTDLLARSVNREREVCEASTSLPGHLAGLRSVNSHCQNPHSSRQRLELCCIYFMLLCALSTETI